MRSVRYLARIVDRRPTTGLTDGMLRRKSHLFEPLLDEVGFGTSIPTTYADFASTMTAWLHARSIDEARSALVEARAFDQELVRLLADDPRSLPRSMSYKVGEVWLANQLLATAHPSEHRSIDAVTVVVEAVTIDPDAGLPNARSRMDDFAVRILIEASGPDPRSWEQSPLLSRFGKAWFDLWLGGNDDDAMGVVPFTDCVQYTPLELGSAAAAREHADAWWAKEPRVQQLTEPSDSQPYAVGRYEFLTFPAWVPSLVEGTFASRAFGWF